MQYLFEETADGSPTLRLKSELKDSSEAMHSTKGAFSETLYIYGEAAHRTLQEGLEPSFLSIGLGLGYVEIAIFALALNNSQAQEVILTSFEADGPLRENFTSWVQGAIIDEAFKRAYDDILKRTGEHFQLNPDELKQALLLALREERLQVRGAFGMESFPQRRFSCLCFDAFSSNSSPELWTAELLDRVCGELTHSSAYFATYASTGHLKRALQAHGFVLVRREGFGGKRESTLAQKKGPD